MGGDREPDANVKKLRYKIYFYFLIINIFVQNGVLKVSPELEGLRRSKWAQMKRNEFESDLVTNIPATFSPRSRWALLVNNNNNNNPY